jgi:hypothetical protein
MTLLGSCSTKFRMEFLTVNLRSTIWCRRKWTNTRQSTRKGRWVWLTM